MDDQCIDKHPSYALLQISKTTHGGATALFGSSIQHQNTIRLSITGAQVKRNLSNDWYMPEKTYIEIEMSANQFAEAIISLNHGSGIPVTLRRLNGQKIENCPYANKKEQFEKELSEAIEKAGDDVLTALNTITKILETKKTLTVKDKQTIIDGLFNISRLHTSQIPFIYSQFNEQMDKTVTEAKQEIESFIQNRVYRLGLDALAGAPESITHTLLNSLPYPDTQLTAEKQKFIDNLPRKDETE